MNERDTVPSIDSWTTEKDIEETCSQGNFFSVRLYIYEKLCHFEYFKNVSLRVSLLSKEFDDRVNSECLNNIIFATNISQGFDDNFS